ncbi:MFS transporter [Streptomyces sp. NBC_00083]|uniref:MFS transporter n=1 Tax=Streptomyces sp. NBC_00083 TaxID=2975647 RepID=UPI0022521920|nr:MFS transporter [Streptomyces sp. NBC_00083]MCX5386228.1 MFS transporter [Streptomyces sp. NBC_00083]
MSEETARTGKKPGSLFRRREFALLWTGQSASLLGSQITYVAMPLTAVLLLRATPMEAGVLVALETLPFLLFGLFVGVMLDRRARRSVMILADAVRAVALAWIPIAHLLGVLNIGQLFVVVFVVGVMTVFFDLAAQSYTPGLIGRERLGEANAKLELSDSVAQVVGPGAAGLMISALSAPVAIAVDAASYLLSFFTVTALPADERPEREPGAAVLSVRASIREGFAAIVRHPLLRWFTTAALIINLFSGALMSVFFLYLLRELDMGSKQVGLIVAVGSIGALVGVLLVGPLTGRFGVGPTLILTMAMPGLGYLVLAAVHGHSLGAIAVVAVSSFFVQFSVPVFNVTVISFRQVSTPDELLGRVNATARTCALGAYSLGSLLGGALASGTGLRTAVVVAATGTFLASLALLFSPVRAVRRLQASPGDAEPAPAPEPA